METNMKDIRNDDDIRLLVETFYGRVQDNERLNHIFSDVAGVDWDHHLPKMIDFWSNLIFQTGRYKGRPFRQHMPLPLEEEDFYLWYGLFEKTVDKLFAGSRADYAKEMASKIAASFSLRMKMEGKFEPKPEKI